MLQNQALDHERHDARTGGIDAEKPDSVAPRSGGPLRIGVVFVHGVGQQTQSETVRWFSEELYNWVTKWHRERKGAGLLEIGNVELSYGNGLSGTPARYELTIPAIGVHPAQTWVLTEGFWADRLVTPSLLTMVGWGLPALSRTIPGLAENALTYPWSRHDEAVRVLHKLRAPPFRYLRTSFGFVIDMFSQILLFFGYLGLQVVGSVLLIALVVPAIIPLKQVQDFILVKILAPILTEFIGDFKVYTDDPLLALHMRNGVTRAVNWLTGVGKKEGRCDTVCVIGHSGGALIAFDAVMNGRPSDVSKVTKLITLGSALNQARLAEVEKRDDIRRVWPDASQRPPQYQGKTRNVYWLDIWSAYDPVALGRFETPNTSKGPDQQFGATNEMNLLTDHGAYFRNDEEVNSRIAQEISTATQVWGDSRFFFKDTHERALRRWERVITLVGWRLAAMYLFVVVALARWTQLPDDGRNVWLVLSRVPAVTGASDTIASILAALQGIAAWASSATAGWWSTPLPALVVTGEVFVFVYWVLYKSWRRSAGVPSDKGRPLRWLRAVASRAVLFAIGVIIAAFVGSMPELLRLNALEPFASRLQALALLGALFALLYSGLTFGIYEPWRRAERVRTVKESLPPTTPGQHLLTALRAVTIPAILLAYAWFVANL